MHILDPLLPPGVSDVQTPSLPWIIANHGRGAAGGDRRGRCRVGGRNGQRGECRAVEPQGKRGDRSAAATSWTNPRFPALPGARSVRTNEVLAPAFEGQILIVSYDAIGITNRHLHIRVRYPGVGYRDTGGETIRVAVRHGKRLPVADGGDGGLEDRLGGRIEHQLRPNPAGGRDIRPSLKER